MKAKRLQMLIFGIILSLPIILSVIFPKFKWVFFIFVAVEWYGLVSRILRGHKALTLVVTGLGVYIFIKLWYLISPLIMFYWIAGSLGFGMISSVIIFGVKGD